MDPELEDSGTSDSSDSEESIRTVLRASSNKVCLLCVYLFSLVVFLMSEELSFLTLLQTSFYLSLLTCF